MPSIGSGLTSGSLIGSSGWSHFYTDLDEPLPDGRSVESELLTYPRQRCAFAVATCGDCDLLDCHASRGAPKLDSMTLADLADSDAVDTEAFGAGESEILQLAAERTMERIFLATSALPLENKIKYLGEEPLRFLRGMRNRLAHNYPGVDNQPLRDTIQQDLPVILANMQKDEEGCEGLLCNRSGRDR